jgi:RimJ/RimL family protein N-acetyltransferase
VSVADGTPTAREVCLPDGTPVVIRPLHHGDEASIDEGFAHLSADSRRLRFFQSIRALPAGHADTLAHADGKDHLAWGIATPSGTGIGIARVVRDRDDPRKGEFAITIADEWQRRGAGIALARALAEASKSVGIDRWLAVVLLENRGILRLLKYVGREISRTSNHDGSADIVLAL